MSVNNNKDRYLVTLQNGDSSIWDGAKYNQRRDQLFNEFPTATATRVQDYNPDDDDIQDTDTFFVKVGDDTAEWDAATFNRRKEQLFTEFPKAQVQKLRRDDYWGEQGDAQKASIQNRLTAISDAEKGIHDAAGKEFEERQNNRSWISKVAENIASGNRAEVDPAGIYTDDSTYQGWLNTGGRKKYGADLKNYQAASQVLREAQQLQNSLTKDEAKASDNILDRLNAFDKGTQQGVKKYATDIESWNQIVGAENAAAMFGLQKKIEKIIAGVDEKADGAAIEQAIQNGLNQSEKTLFDALQASGSVSSALRPKIAGSVKAGEIMAESARLGLEFMLFNGIAGAANRAASRKVEKYLMNRLVKDGAGKFLRKLGTGAAKTLAADVGAIAGGAAQTAIGPSSWKMVTKNAEDTMQAFLSSPAAFMNPETRAQYGIEGPKGAGELALNGFVQALIENATEYGLGPVNKLLGGLGKAGYRGLRKMGWNNLATLLSPQAAAFLNNAGIGNFLEETGEEVNGAIIDYFTGNKDALKSFTNWDDIGVMAASFLPMIGTGAGVSAVQRGVYNNRYNKAADAYRAYLVSQGIDESEADTIIESLDAETPEELGRRAGQLYQALDQRQGGDKATEATLLTNLITATRNRSLANGVNQLMLEESRGDTRDNIMDNTKGRQFWQTREADMVDEGGTPYKGEEEYVDFLTTDGDNNFFIRKEDEDGNIETVDENGTVRRFTADEVERGLADGTFTGRRTMDMNDYLDERSGIQRDKVWQVSSERVSQMASYEGAVAQGSQSIQDVAYDAQQSLATLGKEALEMGVEADELENSSNDIAHAAFEARQNGNIELANTLSAYADAKATVEGLHEGYISGRQQRAEAAIDNQINTYGHDGEMVGATLGDKTVFIQSKDVKVARDGSVVVLGGSANSKVQIIDPVTGETRLVSPAELSGAWSAPVDEYRQNGISVLMEDAEQEYNTAVNTMSHSAMAEAVTPLVGHTAILTNENGEASPVTVVAVNPQAFTATVRDGSRKGQMNEVGIDVLYNQLQKNADGSIVLDATATNNKVEAQPEAQQPQQAPASQTPAQQPAAQSNVPINNYRGKVMLNGELRDVQVTEVDRDGTVQYDLLDSDGEAVGSAEADTPTFRAMIAAAQTPAPAQAAPVAPEPAPAPEPVKEEVKEAVNPQPTKKTDGAWLHDQLAVLFNGKRTEDEIRSTVEKKVQSAQQEYDKARAEVQAKVDALNDLDDLGAEEAEAERLWREDTAFNQASERLNRWTALRDALDRIDSILPRSLNDIKVDTPELDLEPRTGAEVAAYVLSQEGKTPSTRRQITPESYKHELGYGSKEMLMFPGLFSKEGISIDALAKELIDNYPQFFGGEELVGNDMGTGKVADDYYAKEAILEVLRSARTMKDINDYIKNAREAEARKEAEDTESAIVRGLTVDQGITPEEYENGGRSTIINRALESLGDQNTVEDFLNALDERIGSTINRSSAAPTTSAEAELSPEEDLPVAEVSNKETERQRALIERARQWEERTGVKVNLITSKDQVANGQARAAIDEADKVVAEGTPLENVAVTGWFNRVDQSVDIYLPHVLSEEEIDKTFMHEVVSHKGLRELFREVDKDGNVSYEKYNRLLDAVWNDLMTETEKRRWLDYNSFLELEGERERQRAAADEYIAHFSETLNPDVAPGAWEKFVDIIKKLLESVGVKITKKDLSRLLQASLANYEQNRPNSSDPFGDNVQFRRRTKPAPQKTGIGYKAFHLGSDGELYPAMVANPGGEPFIKDTWLDADIGEDAGTSKTGRRKVKAGGKGTRGGGGSLAFRPGFHLGEIPYALQFNVGPKVDNPLGIRNQKGEIIKVGKYFPKDLVWAEVEYAKDADYQDEAMSYGYNEAGNFQHSLAGLPRIPEDGYYRYRTNANPATDPWIITGAMKINRILTNEEVDDLVRAAGREPQLREGDNSIRFRRANVNQEMFVSNAEKAVEGIQQEKATPDQWLKMIESKGGLKAGEDKWLGLSDWLKASDKKSITKQEILDYIDENKIQIEEDRYSEAAEESYAKAIDSFREEFATIPFETNEAKWKEADERVAQFYNDMNEKYGDDYLDMMNVAEREQEEALLTERESFAGEQDVYDAAFEAMKEKYGDDFELAFVQDGNSISPTREWDDELTDAAKYFLDQERDDPGTKGIDSTRLSYTTHGLENKREIALTVPTIDPYNEGDRIHFGDAGEGRAIAWIRFGDATTPSDGGQKREEFEKVMADNEQWFREHPEYAKYGIGGEELDEENQRRTERQREALAESDSVPRSKVLVIDEIQSKRHQDAREQGGYKDDTALKEAEKRLAEAYDAYYGNAGKLIEKYGEGNVRDMMTPEESAESQRLYREYRDAERAVSRNGFDPMADEEYRRLRENQRAHEYSPEFQQLMADWNNAKGPDAREAINKQLKPFQERNRELLDAMDERERILADEWNATHSSKVPAAPFEKNWYELAMKRMLRLAAEEGYDHVAWTTGEQQAERYNIGGVLNSIERRESDNIHEKRFTLNLNTHGTQYLTTDDEGNVTNTLVEDYRGKNLSDIVGKDLAIRMLTMEENETIEGEGLRVGGEGMKGFYDDILPRFMNKYGKQWGVKVEDISLPDAYDETGKPLVMHSVKVTPEMKKSVKEGQVMFRKAPGFNSAEQELEKEGVTVDNPELLKEYGLSNATMTKKGDVVTLNKVIAAEKNQGNGTRFMEGLANEADRNGWTLALTPDDSFGATSVRRLKDFYKRFGFKDNKGRNTDFTINESMVRRPSGVMFRRAYHGTGANFDRFDHSHMGEGEGGQMYGWGTYVTTNRDTGLAYARSIGGSDEQYERAVGSIENQIDKDNADLAKAKTDEEKKRLVDDIALMEQRKEEMKRHLYTVEIPDDNGENYIHWDKPLTLNQVRKIQQAVRERVGDEWGEEFEYELQSALGYGTYGRYVEGALDYFLGDQKDYATGKDPGAERNSKLLNDLGIVGIEIPIDRQGGQRYKGSNYVIFDEKNLDIKDHLRFRKAPNGEKSNLTDEQWELVRTPQFKDWFGDWENDPQNASKVVDENGEPRVVYHGTKWNPLAEKPGKAVFDVNRVGDNFDFVDIDWNFFFTASEASARGYGNAIPVFLNIRNPEIHTINELVSYEMDEETGHDIVVTAHDAGSEYDKVTRVKNPDGVIYTIRAINTNEAEKQFHDAIQAWEGEHRQELEDEYNALKSQADDLYKKIENEYRTLYNELGFQKVFEVEYDKMKERAGYILDETILDAAKVREGVSTEKIEDLQKQFNDVDQKMFKIFQREGIEGRPIYDEYEHLEVPRDYHQTDMFALDNPNQIKSATANNGEFSTENDDIRFREAVGPVARLAEAEREVVDRKLDEMGSALGIPVNRVSRAQMPKGHEYDKGYYDPQTGEMYICMDNVAGINDAVATVLHESVGHLGLRRLLGDRFASTMQQIYAALDEKGRTWVNRYIATHNEAPATRAVEEYLSYLAESGDFMTTERSVWQQIKDIIARAIDAVFGTDFFSFTDDELNYILRASYENLQNPNWLNTVEGWAKDNLMRATLDFNSFNPEQMEDDEILFREKFTPIGNAADDYDQRVKLNHNKMVTEVQNLNRPVQIAYEEVMKETGKKGITEAEDYIQRAEQAGSRAQTEQEQFERDHAVPILEQVREIQSILLKKARSRAKEDANDTIEKSRKKRRIREYERILDYLYAVSALERNRYKNAELAEQKKTAIEEAEAKAEEKRAKVRADVKAEAQADALAKIDNDLRNELAEIEERYAPRDWSGLTSLEGVYDNNALNALRAKPTDSDKRRAELKRQREALRRSWWTEAERRAEERIARMRRLVGDEQLNRLWDLIREATDFNLQHALEHGLLTKEEYDRLHGTEETPRMWNYYLPLRGFTEDAAEQQYDYSHIANGNGGSAVVRKMNGRWSEADNPLANLFNIAQREIAQGWDNWAKMALYRFALNSGENSLLSVKEAWYEKNPETGEWELAQPRANETMDEFENRMQSLKENRQEDGTKGKPLAKKGRRGLELNKIRGSRNGSNEHIIRLKVAGQDKVIWVNADPTMARAVNGTSRGRNMALIRRASRSLSNLFTTYSLNFSIKNLFRDTIYSQLVLRVKESRSYRHKYYKNWIRNIRFLAGPMVRLSRQYENGTLQKKPNLTERERLFIDFMNDGGATGYSIVNSVDTIKRDIERSMRRGGKEVSKYRVPLLGHYAEAVKTLNEGFELLTRFTAYETSRQVGRSGQRAAADAKEISVNFNRRGAQSGEGFWGTVAAYFGATHYFFNAGVQGFDNFMNLIKTKPAKMTRFMAEFMLLGFLTPLINSMLAGMLDDDEDENYDWYWELPQWVRRNNLVMGYRGYYFAIPLSVEVRALYGMGDIAAMVAFSKYAGDNGFNVGLDAMSTAMGILPINPVEDYTASGNFSDTAIRNLAPDIMMPLVDIATNRDYTGRPLSKENPFTHNTPKSQAAFASTPKYLVKACQALAKATATAPIHIDPNPGVWRDIFKSYGGGFYKTAEDVAKITMIDTDHPFRWDNMPFMSGFTGHLDEDRSNSFEIDALNAYKEISEDVVRRLNSVTGGGVTPAIAFKDPESLPDIAQAQIILEGKKYQLAKTYYDGMRNVYKINPKTGKEYTSGAKNLAHKGVNKLYDEWKALYDEWKLMPNASNSEKEAKAAKTLAVQQAWNLYRNAQGNLVDILLEMENGERLSGLEADAYELTKGLVF